LDGVRQREGLRHAGLPAAALRGEQRPPRLRPGRFIKHREVRELFSISVARHRGHVVVAPVRIR
jgi:hypothetical protein